jgi:hypothetical protein
MSKKDYISLTDMAKYKNAEATGYVISRWMSAHYNFHSPFSGNGKNQHQLTLN